jgi:dienelactone hydrolase
VEQAQRLARAGFVVVVGCWLPNAPQTSPWCSNPPDPPTALTNLEAFTRAQRGVRKSRIGVVGFSSGAGPVFNYQWGPWVRALAVDSGIGADQTGQFVTTAAAPVLLLYGTEDENIPQQVNHDFEEELRANDVDVEVERYEGGPHVVTINANGDILAASNRRLAEFFERRLG